MNMSTCAEGHMKQMNKANLVRRKKTHGEPDTYIWSCSVEFTLTLANEEDVNVR